MPMAKQTALQVQRRAYYWLGGLAGFLLFLWIFNGILLPFIAGMALAYFLDPVADYLEKYGISRLWSTVIITALFVVLFILALMVLIPVLAGQLTGFMARLPELVSRLQELIASTRNSWLAERIGLDHASIQKNLNELMTQGAGFVSTVLQQLWASGKSLINVVSLLVVTPVVAFYMLYDWDRMVAKVDSWVPPRHRQTVREISHDIDTAVAAFVRGQGSLCLVLGLFYGASLTLAGLNFGLLIGLVAGLISFIPYVGSLTGLVLAMGVALVQFWPDYFSIALIAVIFGVGQFLEGNILQPKMVGDSIGLHPVWLMFALFAFGSLFGFVGMLVAVPAAAAIGVVVRFAMGRYMASELYSEGADKVDPALLEPPATSRAARGKR
ncbi:MAG: AI-2E family transporter [Nitratireductor sp.]|nr:AI-2E family transporter [Nitratireductor sp.]